MFVEIRRTAVGDLPNPYPDLVDCANRSDPLLTYWFGPECIAIVGFIPLGIISTTAYLWMQNTPYTDKHPVAVARLGRLTLHEIASRYPCVIGECILNSPGHRWVKWLGARFGESNGIAVPFMIGTYE